VKKHTAISVVLATSCISVHAGDPFGNPAFHGMTEAEILASVVVQGGSPTFAIVIESREDEGTAPYCAWLIDRSTGTLYRQSPADFSKATEVRPVMVLSREEYDKVPLGTWIENVHGRRQQKQAAAWKP
jgi:hypothetical protein